MQHELLQIGLSLEEAEAMQDKYSHKLRKIKQDFINYNEINWVVGADVSYNVNRNEEWGAACAVLWNLTSNIMERYSLSKNPINFPYKPGFLGFRECNIIAKALEILPITPDIIMCDGHGIIHPKRFGEAVQLGFAMNIPTFGVAKNPFIGYSDWKKLKRIKRNKTPIWASHPQRNESAELLGYAVCLNDSMKPVFISTGFNVNLEVAIQVALKTTLNHNQPEPLYLADYFSRKEL